MYAVVIMKAGQDAAFPYDNSSILSIHEEGLASCLDAEMEAFALSEKLGVKANGKGGFFLSPCCLFAEAVDQEWLDLNRP